MRISLPNLDHFGELTFSRFANKNSSFLVVPKILFTSLQLDLRRQCKRQRNFQKFSIFGKNDLPILILLNQKSSEHYFFIRIVTFTITWIMKQTKRSNLACVKVIFFFLAIMVVVPVFGQKKKSKYSYGRGSMFRYWGYNR